MSTAPQISIITPSLNQGDFIELNIRSILDQGYPNLEHIIIDGGSTDQTIDVIGKHADHISYWISEPDSGQSDAINKGLKRASGEIITWINSDDELTPGALNIVSNLFEKNSNIDLVHGKTNLLLPNGKISSRGADLFHLESQYLAGVAFPQPSSFFKKQLLDKVGLLNENLHFGMDYDLFARMALVGDFLSVTDTLSVYRLHEDSKSTTSEIKFADEWVKVYSRMLRSLPNTDSLIDQLNDLDLYDNKDSIFPREKEFSKEIVENSLPAFLKFQINFRYNSAQLDKVKMLTAKMKNSFPEWYEHEGLAKEHFRSHYLNAGLIKFIRNFSRP